MREDWSLVNLGDVCGLDKKPFSDGTLPYIGMEDIESMTGCFIGSFEPRAVKSNTFHFRSEHILYGRLRPYLNKVLLPDFEGHCSTEVFPIRVTGGLDRKYLFYWLTHSSTVEKINATCTGARMPRANFKDILEFKFPLPPLPEQKRIVAILDEAFEAITTAATNAEKNLANARELFESYLNLVFSQKGDGWGEVALEEHIRFIDYRGKTPKKVEYGLRLITAKNVRMGFLQKKPEEFVNPDSYETWMTRGIPLEGDVLFTTEAPLGFVCQLDTREKVVFAQRIITLQPDRSVLEPIFLKYALMSSILQRRIHERATGATAKGIKASLLKKVLLPIPPIATQLESPRVFRRLGCLSQATIADSSCC